jgi:hypothetical protein
MGEWACRRLKPLGDPSAGDPTLRGRLRRKNRPRGCRSSSESSRRLRRPSTSNDYVVAVTGGDVILPTSVAQRLPQVRSGTEDDVESGRCHSGSLFDCTVAIAADAEVPFLCVFNDVASDEKVVESARALLFKSQSANREGGGYPPCFACQGYGGRQIRCRGQ